MIRIYGAPQPTFVDLPLVEAINMEHSHGGPDIGYIEDDDTGKVLVWVERVMGPAPPGLAVAVARGVEVDAARQNWEGVGDLQLKSGRSKFADNRTSPPPEESP